MIENPTIYDYGPIPDTEGLAGVPARILTQHKELDHLEDYQPQQVYTHYGQIACQRLFETPGCRGGLMRGK